MRIEDAKLESIGYDFTNKRTKIEFSCYGDITPSLEEYMSQKINLELKKSRRSNTANGYLWILLGELQEKLNIPKEEIYRQYVYSCGAYDVYQMPEDALKRFIKGWSGLGLGWVCDVAERRGNMVTVLAYRGSSDYSKDEMRVLLEQVVQDCIEQGIPTRRKEEIENLIKEW